MADMGFLPVVKKLLDQTPADTQHLLFSATLDNGIDTLVNRYLHNPVLRTVDPVESVEVKMTHHVFAVAADDRFPVLRDLAAAPGRIIVFTRTKHGAKKLTRALITSGVPAVELQGNLSQNLRTKNLEAFRSGEASALVATDIAARGIHIDEVALVVHFDPPCRPQGLPPPVRAYRPSRRRRHCDHDDARFTSVRSSRPHPQSRDRPDRHHGHADPSTHPADRPG